MKIPAKTKRIMDVMSWVILGLYIAAYLTLSLNGHYSDELYITGRLRDSSYGTGIPDAHIWEPKFVKLTPHEENWVGLCFWPVLWTDRKFWHARVMLSPSERMYPPGSYIDSDASFLR
jgi:hypothetical protein